MNFAKFRQTGELSDISVIVDDTEFKLHKFPLYAKSDFFCALAKSPGSDLNKVELKDFPGGPDAFGVIADFCYNMKIDISKTNVVHIRCAAEVLQMTGAGNLTEVSDKYLLDTITSAKMSRQTSVITSLLMTCVNSAAVAEKANIVNVCCEALVDAWLKPPTKFSSPTSSKTGSSSDRGEDNIRLLFGLPLAWFLKLLALARDNGVQKSHMAEMATLYISTFIEKEEADDKTSAVSEQKKADALDAKVGSKSGRNSHDFGMAKDAKSGMKSKKKNETGKVIDAILSELPEDALKEPTVTTDWITKVLKLATAHNCKCRRTLVRVTGERLNSLSSEDLCIISPSVLKDIVSESCNGDNDHATDACQLVENYMNEMARKGVLTAETYKTLVSAGPPNGRTSHDSLYGILEYVLTAGEYWVLVWLSEKDKLIQEQREDLIDTIDFSLVGEATLKRAFETQVVPASYVAKGALALCATLKSELESAKNTVCKQEDELQRLRRTRTVTPQMTSSPKKDTDSSHSSFSDVPVRDTNTANVTLEVPHPVDPSPRESNMTEEVLMAARSKLAASVAAYSTFRPLSADREAEYGYEDERDYAYERQFRSYDNARKPGRTGSSFRSSYSSYPHRI